MQGSLLAVLVLSVLLAALARRFDVSAPLALVVAGLAVSAIPGFTDIELEPELVLYVLLPPLLWSAGLESSYVGLKTEHPADRAARRRAAAGDDVRGRLRRLQDGARADGCGCAHPRRDRGSARRGLGDGGRPQARAAAPDHDAARR